MKPSKEIYSKTKLCDTLIPTALPDGSTTVARRYFLVERGRASTSYFSPSGRLQPSRVVVCFHRDFSLYQALNTPLFIT